MSVGQAAGILAKKPFSVSFYIVTAGSPLKHRPVDPCLSHRVCHGQPGQPPGELSQVYVPFSFLKSVTFLAGHGEICHPHGRSTWRPADQPTTRRSTWISCLFKENHARNPCGSACCGLVCGSQCGSPMWGANFAMAC